MIVTIILPLPPSTNHLFRNATSGRRPKTAEYRAWIKEAGWRLLQQRPIKIKGPVELEFWFAEPKDGRTMDLSNRLKAVEDLLVTHRVIEADHNKIVRSIKLQWSDIEGCAVQIVSIAAQEVAA